MSPPPSPDQPRDRSAFLSQQPMRLFQKTLSAPPSSSSPSSSSGRDHPIDRRGQSSFTERRLTRQRKLRHATDEELGLNFSPITDSPSPPASDRHWSCSAVPSPPAPDRHWSCSAVPLPLPLPGSPLTRRRLPESRSGQPDAEPGCSPARRNSSEQVATGTALSRSPPSGSSGPRRALSQDSHIGFPNYNLPRLHIPARSAPTSGFTSPNVSPRRPASGDRTVFYFNCHSEGNIFFNSHDPINHIVKPNFSPKSAPASGLVSPSLSSPDHSPLHSPHLHCNSPCIRPNKSSKLQPSFSCPVSAHPLPRPPSATPAAAPSLPSIMPSPPRAIVHRADGGAPLWQKGRLIGRGTYGSVYHGTHRVTGASCAIKEVDLIPDDPKSAECVKQLEQEINVLSKLEHGNIVQYYGSEIVGDHLYIYLEYVHPGSLNKYVNEHCENMTESIVRNFTRHILCGLAYLHSRKTIHRDIKGANLLVDQSGTVKLADFGTAKHLTGLSSQLSLKGSPHWMAPEVMKAVMQKESNPDHAFAVDIWSLGCTIIEMFTGKPPWGDLNGPQAMFKVLNRSPTIPEKLSPEGKDFLCLCFQRNPAERPSASALLGHSFVRNCDDPPVSIHSSRMNCADKSQSSRYCNSRETDLIPGPTSAQITNTILSTNSERARPSGTRTSCCPSPAHHSRCSMFEPLPSPSTMPPVSGLHNFSSSASIFSLPRHDSANNHPLALSRTHGREVPHI